jgi:hypothetical protein
MQGSSSVKPQVIEQANGKHQFRYNFKEIPAEDEKTAEWQYDYVEVTELDRKVIIDTMITAKYSYPSQLGKLALSKSSAEWIEYNAYRLFCIDAVADAFKD